MAMQPNTMQVSPWTNSCGCYGIRIGIPNRKDYFKKTWSKIIVEIGSEPHEFRLTSSFWNNCPSIRGVVLKRWLASHSMLTWAKGSHPQISLVMLGGNRFRLSAK